MEAASGYFEDKLFILLSLYSIEIFKENPHLRVSELAEMSGFHTLVSYNMAFRLVMNESPGEWCRRTRLVSSGREDLPDE